MSIRYPCIAPEEAALLDANHSMPLELAELEDPARNPELAAEWASLWKRCPAATPFQHPAWLVPWWLHLWDSGQALARLGCGTALVRRAMEAAIDEGLQKFDFLRQPEAFKYLWGARDRCNLRLVIEAAAG